MSELSQLTALPLCALLYLLHELKRRSILSYIGGLYHLSHDQVSTRYHLAQPRLGEYLVCMCPGTWLAIVVVCGLAESWWLSLPYTTVGPALLYMYVRLGVRGEI